MNIYDAFGKCWNQTNSVGAPEAYKGRFEGLLRVGNEIKPYRRYYTAAEATPFLKDGPYRKLKNLKLNPPCVYVTPVNEYLNNPSVRT